MLLALPLVCRLVDGRSLPRLNGIFIIIITSGYFWLYLGTAASIQILCGAAALAWLKLVKYKMVSVIVIIVMIIID